MSKSVHNEIPCARACVPRACIRERGHAPNERTYTIEGGENQANIMGRMSLATRSRVVMLSRSGYPLRKIQAHLALEDITVSKKLLCLLIKKYRMTGSVADNRKVKPPKKLKDEHYRFIDECMADDDELTATKVHAMLKEKYPALIVSVSTVKRAHMELGWTAKKTRYGAMITENNQEKRVEWCRERLDTGDTDFDDVIFTDECMVQLESHRQITFYKKGQPIRYKMKAKHPPPKSTFGLASLLVVQLRL